MNLGNVIQSSCSIVATYWKARICLAYSTIRQRFLVCRIFHRGKRYQATSITCRAKGDREAQYAKADYAHHNYEPLSEAEKRKEPLAMLKRDKVFAAYFLYINLCVLSSLYLTSEALDDDEYRVFTVEPLHTSHVGISKQLKECTEAY